jgi:tricorn protease
MKKIIGFSCLVLAAMHTGAQETLLLRHPSVSADKLAFAYGSDIWVSGRDGSNPQRLTINPDVEYNPVISPDGKWIAFSGNYEGNIDVYIVPVSGGNPKRLTYHPNPDVVKGWAGGKVIYSSSKGIGHSPVRKAFPG